MGPKLRRKEAVASILVIEDDRVARLSLTMFLRTGGHAVREAIDGETAVTLSSLPFDFVISDLHLPGRLTGIDVLNVANNSPHDIAAMLISSDVHAKEKADALGVVYMEKPIVLKEVARIIEDKLRK